MGKRPLCLSFCAHSIGQWARNQHLGLCFAIQLSIFCDFSFHLCCFAIPICLTTHQVHEGFILSRNTVTAGRVLRATLTVKKKKEMLVAQCVGSGLSTGFLVQATVEGQK